MPRKKPYEAGMAQINFKPKFDWEIAEAKQIYEKSKHLIVSDLILYKDCINGMKTLSKECFDLIIADPPFGIDFSGKESLYNRKSDFVVDGYSEIKQDYSKFTEDWISELPRLMKPTASAYIFSGFNNLIDVLQAIKNSKLTLINHIIWKYQFGVFTRRKFVISHYHVLFVVKNPKKYFFNKIEHYPLDVWNLPKKYLPNQKKNSTKLPETVVTRAIDFSSKVGDLVFDPFMGNGTTAVCCKMNYRKFFGFEINPNMKEIIDFNLNTVKLGSNYQPYYTYLPTIEELAEKYSAVRKYLREKNKGGDILE